MKSYTTLKQFYEDVKSGKIDETKLEIVLDNDCTAFYVGPYQDEDCKEIDNEIEVKETNGYSDIEMLYSLLFPKAKVGWC